MSTPIKGHRIGGSASHQKLMLENLSISLFKYGQIKTTYTKAKYLRPFVEKIITTVKKGNLSSYRKIASIIRDKTVVYDLFNKIVKDMQNRQGGYTRIIKLGNRKGDNAPMVVIELIDSNKIT